MCSGLGSTHHIGRLDHSYLRAEKISPDVLGAVEIHDVHEGSVSGSRRETHPCHWVYYYYYRYPFFMKVLVWNQVVWEIDGRAGCENKRIAVRFEMCVDVEWYEACCTR